MLKGVFVCLQFLVVVAASSSNCSVTLDGFSYKFDAVFASGSLLWSGFVESVNTDVCVAVNVCGQAQMSEVDCSMGAGVCVFAPDAGETDNAGFFANATFIALATSKGAMATLKGQVFPSMMSNVFLVCNAQVQVPTIVSVNVSPYADHAIFSISIVAASACPVG